MIGWLTLTNYVDVGRQTVDVGVYRPSFDGGVGVIRASGKILDHGALCTTAHIMKRHMSHASRPPMMLLVAALLLAVGIGNLWIGQAKSNYYSKEVLEASTPTKDHPHGKHAPDSPYFKRLRSRADYYEIVRGGGFAMLFSSVILVLIHVARERTRGSITGTSGLPEMSSKP